MLTATDLEKINEGDAAEVFFRLFFDRLVNDVRWRIDLTGCTEGDLRENLMKALVLHADLESTKPLVDAFIRPVVETAIVKGIERGLFQTKRAAVRRKGANSR